MYDPIQRIYIPGKVPSVNALYTNIRGGGRILSAEGRKYKNNANQHILGGLDSSRKIEPNKPVDVRLLFLISNLVNIGWNKKNGSATRFKRIDLDNKAKVVIDCLFGTLGIDDSVVTKLFLAKTQSAEEGVWIFLGQQTQLEDDLTFAYEMDPVCLVM